MFVGGVFFDGPTTRAKNYFAFSKCSFRCCATLLRSCAGLVIGASLLAHPNTPSFHLSYAHFLITLCIQFDIPHPAIAHFSQCQCGHTINDLCIQLLHCLYGNECTATHDMLQDVVVAITSKSGTHVQQEVSYFFPPPHTKMNGSCHHQRQFSNPNGRCHCHLTRTDLV